MFRATFLVWRPASPNLLPAVVALLSTVASFCRWTAAIAVSLWSFLASPFNNSIRCVQHSAARRGNYLRRGVTSASRLTLAETRSNQPRCSGDLSGKITLKTTPVNIIDFVAVCLPGSVPSADLVGAMQLLQGHRKSLLICLGPRVLLPQPGVSVSTREW